MARKSRKNPAPVEPLAPEPIIYRVGGYVRQSSDDKRKKGDTIETQKRIIQDYIDQNPDLRFSGFYVDNGKTGTNFERQAFQHLMTDAEAGTINCIIVKDLSRFGRNAVEAGFYLERQLPAMHIRFIAVTDSFDSNNGDGGMILALKNVINEAYALDISRKCQAVKRQSIQEGLFIGGQAPYGYIKAPNNCHKLMIDQATAPIVKKIFDLTEQGFSPYEIIQELNASAVPPPSRDKQEKGILDPDKLQARYWGRTMILSILNDVAYIGCLAQGKTRSDCNYRVKVPREEWVVIENTHEPIISREQFERVKEIRQKSCLDLANNRGAAIPYSPSLFSGKVFCGHCGYSMRRTRQNKDGVYWFRCESQVKYAKKACVQVSIKEEDLKSAAVTMLHKYIEILLGRKLRLCRKAAGTTSAIPNTNAELVTVQRAMDKNRDMLKTLVEQLMLGELSQDAFSEKKQANADELAALTERAIELETSPKRLESKIKECWELADCLSATECKYDLTAEILNSLVEKILVFHDKSFEIVWRFAGEFERSAAS